MDKENILTRRRELLFTCLKFSSEVREILTVFDRMLINQERASLMQPNALRRRQAVPDSVELKIKLIWQLLPEYKWQLLNEDYYDDNARLPTE